MHTFQLFDVPLTCQRMYYVNICKHLCVSYFFKPQMFRLYWETRQHEKDEVNSWTNFLSSAVTTFFQCDV